MQCLEQVEVPVRIGITAYDGGWPWQFWSDPKGEGVAMFANSFEVWPLQADLRQQLGHLLQVLQNTIVRHRKPLSHILICISDNNLTRRDLYFSFAKGKVQKVQDLQQLTLQVSFEKKSSLSCRESVACSRPEVLPVKLLHSNCWPLASSDEKLEAHLLFFL